MSERESQRNPQVNLRTVGSVLNVVSIVAMYAPVRFGNMWWAVPGFALWLVGGYLYVNGDEVSLV
jgi:hypothetical protein